MGLEIVTPPMFILRVEFFQKTVVKKSVEIHQPKDAPLFFVAELRVSDDEVTTFEIPKHFGQHGAVHFGRRHDRRPYTMTNSDLSESILRCNSANSLSLPIIFAFAIHE